MDALASVVDRQSLEYLPLAPLDATAARIDAARGTADSNADYLFGTVQGLAGARIPDLPLLRLQEAVRRRLGQDAT